MDRRTGVRRAMAVLLLGWCAAIGPGLGAGSVSRVEKLLREEKIGPARELCSRLTGNEAAWSWPLLGDACLKAGLPEEAIDCYRRGVPAVGLARAWTLLAEASLGRGETERARDEYRRALLTYETLIRDDRCIWEPAWNRERLEARSKWRQLGGSREADEERETLRPLLGRAADYCRGLEEAVLHYICEEEVVETVDRSHPLAEALLGLDPAGPKAVSRRRRRELFDYLLIGQEGTVREKRIPLRRSGHPAGPELGDLYVSHYQLRRMIYTPLVLFAAGQNPLYDYHLLERRSDAAGPLVIVEALPLVFQTPPLAFGRAWLREDGRVERIELSVKSIQNYEAVFQTARAHNWMPAILFAIDFLKVYRGIGFPSAVRLRDSYTDQSGRESVVSDVEINYDQFRFYRVEASEEIRTPD